MHLAVKTSEEIMTTRSIRALILKGANPSLKDTEDHQPIDYLTEFDLTQAATVGLVREI